MIFNASGGAYKDKEAALNKIKMLGSQNHCLLRYELVNEYRNLNFKTKGVRKVADSILLTVFITMLVLYVISEVIQR